MPPDLGLAAKLFAEFIHHRSVAVTFSGQIVPQPIDMTPVAIVAGALGASGETLLWLLADVAAFDAEYRRQRFADMGKGAG